MSDNLQVYLRENVYLVDGCVNAAIYDLNNGNLYRISGGSKSLLFSLLHGEQKSCNEIEKQFIDCLISKNLITYEYVSCHHINQLHCDEKISFVWIEITTGCNLRCVHCYDEAGSVLKVMDYGLFCHIVDELVRNNISKVQIIGGEPFILGDELLKYLDYCVGKFEMIEIFTNGTLINDHQIEYLKRHNIRIALSVYSYKSYVHDFITQIEGSHLKTNHTIERLQENGITYRVKNVVMNGLDQGLPNTSLYRLDPNHDIVRMVGRANLDLLNKKLLKQKLITEKNIGRRLNKKTVARMVNGHNCFFRRLYFAVDGIVFPCVMERRVSHGSIIHQELVNVINSKLREFNKDYIEECKCCEFRYCCFDCRPDSLSDDIHAKPWYCTYYPKIGKWKDPDEFVDEFFDKNMK